MQISVTQAKGQLTELVRRAEAGEEVVLTRHGRATVRLAPVERRPTAAERRAAIAEIRAAAANKITEGPSAARSQDFLYDDNGLPA
ncbi:MAG: type II toxin-antitoxin system prevent-host-death family antitoxin [Rhodospirillaceae bacterium]|nr:type II toxin-antitoxin system prevent-host-death family antitoxin [Rhodospirillaceae bacterium]MCY4065806.1 type II toxin-antitoxin system prevent-host-death family antitoxin [Rhodospirillaceae bacterium]